MLLDECSVGVFYTAFDEVVSSPLKQLLTMMFLCVERVLLDWSIQQHFAGVVAMNKTTKHITLGLLMGLACQTVVAATTWSFTSGGTEGGAVGSYGNSRQWTSGGITVTATAWSNTVGTANSAIEEAYVGAYTGGLGVQNKDCSGSNCIVAATGSTDAGEGVAPEHTLDNQGRFDSILFTFSTAVSIDYLKLGYISGDSDVMTLAYTANNGGPADVNDILKGKTYASLVSNGWALTGTSAGTGSTSLSTNRDANNVVSSATSMYWLVSVANGSDTKLWAPDANYDYVKIASLTGAAPPPPPPKVPEPASAALFGIALAGLAASRRKVRS